MSNDLEFHYVVSYREGYGWTVAADTENAVMPDGIIYNWDTNSWEIPREETFSLDIKHYRMLNSALRLLNEGAINA
jgi:hypothetical protein